MSWLYSLLGPYTFDMFSFGLSFLQCSLCVFLFSRSLKKHKLFPLRIVVALIIGLAACYGLSVVNTMFKTLFVRVMCHLGCACLTLAMGFLCYRDNLENILLCFCSGIATQQISGRLYPLIQNILGINDRVTISLIHSSSENLADWEWLVFLGFHLVSYLVLSAAFRPRRRLTQNKKIRRRVTWMAVLVIVVINILVCIARVYEAESFALTIVVKIFNIGFGIVVLVACAGILTQSDREQQLTVLTQLWKQDRTQFESVKANMDVINMKCHDLKHILGRIENKLTDQEIEDLKKAIEIYDAHIKTGNEVLDVVLCEKAMLCRQNNIQFSCMADAKKLCFLTPVHTYTLFGNIMDNAVEAVQKLSDPEDRVISIVCRDNGDHIEIEESNFFAGTVSLEDGLPQTSKEDPHHHGYGTRSIQHIVKLYNGTMCVKAEDNMFFLNIRLPLP